MYPKWAKNWEFATRNCNSNIDWEKHLSSEDGKDFYTTVMVAGKPMKIFVATEEVKIKKEKLDISEGPIVQSTGKEEVHGLFESSVSQSNNNLGK